MFHERRFLRICSFGGIRLHIVIVGFCNNSENTFRWCSHLMLSYSRVSLCSMDLLLIK